MCISVNDKCTFTLEILPRRSSNLVWKGNFDGVFFWKINLFWGEWKMIWISKSLLHFFDINLIGFWIFLSYRWDYSSSSNAQVPNVYMGRSWNVGRPKPNPFASKSSENVLQGLLGKIGLKILWKLVWDDCCLTFLLDSWVSSVFHAT